MSVTKAELEAINRKLQEALRILSTANRELHKENQALTQQLTACSEQLQILNVRYRRLTRYIGQLRVWLSAKER